MAPCESEISDIENIPFPWRPKKRFFGNKELAPSLRTEKAIFRKRKDSLFRGALEKPFFGYRKKLIFHGGLKKRVFGSRKNRVFIAH